MSRFTVLLVVGMLLHSYYYTVTPKCRQSVRESQHTSETLAAIMQPSLILHSDIYRGGLQFRRISTVAQKYFDALPCFSHDIHATLSINCKYISFNPNVPCLNVILTNSMQNFTNSMQNFTFCYMAEILPIRRKTLSNQSINHFLLNCTAMFTLARRGSANHPHESTGELRYLYL